MHTTKLPLYAMAFGNFAVGIGALVIAGVLQPIAATFVTPISTVGQLITIYALAYAFSSPLLIALTGPVSRRLMLTIGLGLALAGNLLAALAPSYAVLYMARILTAFGAAIFTPLAAATAATLSGPKDRGKAIALVFAGFTAATALGVPLGTYVGLSFGWRLTFGLVAGLALLGAVAVYTAVPRQVATPPVALQSFVRVLRNVPLLVVLTVTLVQLTAQLMLFTFIAPWLEQYLGLGATGITLMLLAFGVASFIGNFVGGYGADRIGTRPTLLVFLLALTGSLFALPVMARWPVLGVLVLMLWGMVGLGFQAPQQVRLVGLAPQLQTAVLGLNASFIYLGISLGSYLGGVAVDQRGLASLNGLGGALGIVTVVIFALTWSFESRMSITPDT